MSVYLEQLLRGIRLAIAVIIAGLHVLLGGATLQTTPSPAPTPTLLTATSTPGQSTTTPKVVVKPSKPAPKPITLVVPEPQPMVPAPDPTVLNQSVRNAVVNILCNLTTDTYSRTISASGVFIDTRGILLTNAHVAQYLLLANYPTPGATYCTIRTGSPAQAAYTATLLYLPPKWVTQNATQITTREASGTGENDYALLLVTAAAPGSPPLPASFSALPMSSAVEKLGTPVLLSAYPAGFFGASTIATNLFNTSTFAALEGYYTFGSSSIDVISLGGSVAAQAGSSGGAVVNANTGDLIGLIATETSSSTTAGRNLRAITFGYINRSLEEAGFGGIDTLLHENPYNLARTFSETVAPPLRTELIAALEH